MTKKIKIKCSCCDKNVTIEVDESEIQAYKEVDEKGNRLLYLCERCSAVGEIRMENNGILV